MTGKARALAASAAVFCIALVAGAIPAAGDIVIGDQHIVRDDPSGITIDLPDALNVPDVKIPKPGLSGRPACSDGLDNDGDTKIDHPLDPGCADPADNDEVDETDSGSSAPDSSEGDGNDDEGSDKSGGRDDGDTSAGRSDRARRPRKPRKPDKRTTDGRPTHTNPGASFVDPGPAPIGVPNFLIDRFRIPPFLLPIYQAAGIQYGIRWEILAAINEIETDYGRNLNVSSAGALGWMQFMPATWKQYGVDANDDERKDPYNPVDAIFAAARYLRAAGGHKDLRRAIFAYNHATWYVDSVLLRARVIGGLPPDFVGSLSGLTQGHFPVAAKASYAEDIDEREALRRAKPRRRTRGNAADLIEASPTRRGIDIYARRGAPVVAVNDGVIKKVGVSERLGRYVVMQDVYGNRYTYSGLGRVSTVYPVPKEKRLSADDFRLVKPTKDPKPTKAASAKGSDREIGGRAGGAVDTEDSRDRLYASPARPANVDRADLTGQLDDLLAAKLPGYTTFSAYFTKVFKFDRKTMIMRRLREGSRVTAGTVLGRIGKIEKGQAPHVNFSIRPTGKGAPRIDPKPILDGWKLLESTAIYRAAGENPFISDPRRASVGQVLLMSKRGLERRVLADPRIELYSCGRDDVATGRLDRRLLTAISYLAERGFRIGVSSLRCGRENSITTSGNVSHHASGNAADIPTINGIPVLGNQGEGSVAEALIRELMKLQGNLRPTQVISLMDMGGPTFAMGDHADHVHVGYRPLFGSQSDIGRSVGQILKPEQWTKLIGRLYEIDNPTVRTRPSRASIPVKPRR